MKSSLFVSLFVVLVRIYPNGNARYLLVNIDDEKEHAVEESEGTFGTPYHHYIFSMCLIGHRELFKITNIELCLLMFFTNH